MPLFSKLSGFSEGLSAYDTWHMKDFTYCTIPKTGISYYKYSIMRDEVAFDFEPCEFDRE